MPTRSLSDCVLNVWPGSVLCHDKLCDWSLRGVSPCARQEEGKAVTFWREFGLPGGIEFQAQDRSEGNLGCGPAKG